MDIRSYFNAVNKATGKPEKRKIENKSSEEDSPVAKRKHTKVISPDEKKKVTKSKVEKSKKKATAAPISDSDEEMIVSKKKKSASSKTKAPKEKNVTIIDDSEEDIPIKKTKKSVRILDSEDEEEDVPVKPLPKKEKSQLKNKPNKINDCLDSQSVFKSKDSQKQLNVNENSKSPIKKSPKKMSTISPEQKENKKQSSPKPKTPWVQVPRDSMPKLPVSEMWVDKYKPTTVNQVIGQQGAQSGAKKLLKWISNWFRNKDVKPAYGKFGSDDGSGFKAALLSGPPGIGKTTTAHLAAKECGFEFVEFNASDTRNKKSMEEHIRTLLTNRAISASFGAGGKSTTSKHLLIMDEVDGMGGNADRGGVAELIQLIKNTKIPIICICNDRNSPKIRSLANYCFDLRFMRPRVEQIKSAMMSICYKEDVKIDPQVLTQIIDSSNHDVRQVLHYLSLYTSKEHKMNKLTSSQPIKDVKLGPFDACKKIFSSGPEYEAMSFHDKSDLFFADYSLMPLFAYDNYIRCNPIKAKGDLDKLKAATRAVSAISFGDTIETEIRQKQNWSLLPLQAAFATVMPGFYVNGFFSGQISFPALLGKISNMNKRERLLAELKQHMNLKISGGKNALNIDYLLPLRNRILKPLLSKDKDAVEKTIDALHEYNLRKDDIESIIELSLWGSEKNPFTQVDSKIKAALTRSYNKSSELLPYATEDMFKKTKVKGAKATKAGKSKNNDDSEDENMQEELDENELIPDF